MANGSNAKFFPPELVELVPTAAEAALAPELQRQAVVRYYLQQLGPVLRGHAGRPTVVRVDGSDVAADLQAILEQRGWKADTGYNYVDGSCMLFVQPAPTEVPQPSLIDELIGLLSRLRARLRKRG